MSDKHAHLVMEQDHMEKLYTSKNPLVRYYFNTRLEESFHLAELQGTETVLDAGCGEGQFLTFLEQKMPNLQLYGADVTQVAVDTAAQRTRAKLINQDLAHLSTIKDGFFDVVFCLDVIEHVKDYQNVLNEFKRITKPGGKIVIAFPNDTINIIARLMLFKWPPKVPDHINQFTPASMTRLLDLRMLKSRRLLFNLPFPLALWCGCSFRR